jgi:spore coat polysaccharide biosynthesis protein SpsF
MKDLAGKPTLSRVIERCRAIPVANEVVIATTTHERDDVIVDLCKSEGVPCFRGSESDVLSRYYGAAKEHGADVVVRITSDCPLIDPGTSTKVIQHFLEDGKFDYCCNWMTPTYPKGLDTEVFLFSALEKAQQEAHSDYDREHVTPYIHDNPQLFRIKVLTNDTDYSMYRWTLDTQADYELISEMYRQLHRPGEIFTFAEGIELMKRQPEMAFINQ